MPSIRISHVPESVYFFKQCKVILRKYTKGGKISSLTALGSLVMIVLAVLISTLMRGHAGIYVGLMLFVSLIASAIGFGIGIKSFDEENRFMRYTIFRINILIQFFILMLKLF